MEGHCSMCGEPWDRVSSGCPECNDRSVGLRLAAELQRVERERTERKAAAHRFAVSERAKGGES